MSNHTPTHLTTLLLHHIKPQIWPGLHGLTFFHRSIRQPPSTFWYLLLSVARIRPWGRRSLFVRRSSSNNYGLSFMKWTVFRPPVINYHGPMSELLWSIVWIRPWREGFRVGLFMTWKVHLIHCLFITDLVVTYTIMWIIGVVKYSTMKSNVYDLIKYTTLLKYMIMTESIRSFQMIHLFKIYDHLLKSIGFSEITIWKTETIRSLGRQLDAVKKTIFRP